jgi:ribosomal peptide maturation radical SAM protein 1
MDCIDYAITGEADRSFPEFLVAVAEGHDPLDVPGVLARRGTDVVGTPPKPFYELDELPLPDFSEYFERSDRLGVTPEDRVRHDFWLPYESARGGWWGEKRHCTFCGLNGETMAYRSKSAPKVAAELDALASEYGVFSFAVTDNILDKEHIHGLFPQVARPHRTYQFFYEVKADLRPAELYLLRKGGVVRLQPGIESLSAHLLQLMRKGTRPWQNVNVLRWCRYLGIRAEWNILCGFPGETESDYAEQQAVIPYLEHLEPPGTCRRLWLERFSPLFTERDTFPAEWIQPKEYYRCVYPSSVDREKVAYYFDYSLERTLGDEAYLPLRETVGEWQRSWSPTDACALRFWTSGRRLTIEDRRPRTENGIHTFRDELARLYLACAETAVSASKALEAAEIVADVEEGTAALDEFCHRGLMFRDGNLYLSLALPHDTRAYELTYYPRH